ncbi:Os08g0451651 [Oryza sativa Japonica Group]|uniref:Os08g0451651 protein n=1 Tax=Oryza sativa subsp. japonica TaxID=39947 RepID=A0A0P0XGA8_ORYSJ|nr:Os08g0451651 [Oryza sativa Japonica Group]
MWEEARLCEEKGKRQRCARRCSGHRRRQENDEAAVLVKREHPGRAVAADAARREHLDRTAASDSVAAACHLWSAFDLMTRRKDPLDGLKLYSGDEHYWFVSSSSSSSPPLDPHVHPPFLFHGCFLI